MSSYLQSQLQEYFPKYSSFWKAAFEMYTDIDELLKAKKRPIFIAVTGGAGSGKTTFCEMIDFFVEANNLKSVVISSDDFYLSVEERKAKGIKWRGSIESHDLEKLKKVFNALGQKTLPVNIPVFDHGIDASGKPQKIEEVPDIVFFEGWMVPALIDKLYGDHKKVFDRTIYLDMSLEDLKERRFKREASILELTGKGMNADQMQAFWDEGIVPNIKANVLPYREKADKVYGFEIQDGNDLKYI